MYNHDQHSDRGFYPWAHINSYAIGQNGKGFPHKGNPVHIYTAAGGAETTSKAQAQRWRDAGIPFTTYTTVG